jgi:hypothetical protein
MADVRLGVLKDKRECVAFRMHGINQGWQLELGLFKAARKHLVPKSTKSGNDFRISERLVESVNELCVVKSLQLFTHLLGTAPHDRAVGAPKGKQGNRACLEESLEGNFIWLQSAHTANDAFEAIDLLVSLNFVLISSH